MRDVVKFFEKLKSLNVRVVGISEGTKEDFKMTAAVNHPEMFVGKGKNLHVVDYINRIVYYVHPDDIDNVGWGKTKDGIQVINLLSNKWTIDKYKN